MNQILFSLFFLCFNFSFSQDYIEYYNICNEAEYLFDNDRFPEAEAKYKEAFELVEVAKSKDVLLCMRCMIWDERRTEAYQLYYDHLLNSKALDKFSMDWLRTFNIYFTGHQEYELSQLQPDTLSNEYVFGNRVDSLLVELVKVDQKLRLSTGKLGRRHEDSIYWVEGSDSTLVNSSVKYAEITDFVDSSLIELINSGWIDTAFQYSQVDFGLLLIHMDHDHFKLIEVQLMDLIRKGKMEPWQFARVVDRIYGSEGECPPYLVYTSRDFIYCNSLEQVKGYRRQIGLTTYYTDASVFRHIRLTKSSMKRPLDDFYNRMENLNHSN